ncbi:hypothetical protein AB0H76_33995 [Nocardia sp. NPDC050712]|uniref:hypothetical protein n=1 Tax=Nocardia sp. NPDC050712 TaxID=3155518 RepID=UPI0033E4B351
MEQLRFEITKYDPAKYPTTFETVVVDPSLYPDRVDLEMAEEEARRHNDSGSPGERSEFDLTVPNVFSEHSLLGPPQVVSSRPKGLLTGLSIYVPPNWGGLTVYQLQDFDDNSAVCGIADSDFALVCELVEGVQFGSMSRHYDDDGIVIFSLETT